jgi:ferredoxin-NADP reductase
VRSLAKLHTVKPQTPGISTLRLNVPLTFKPGQSIQITLPGDPKKRHYSISSSPTEGAYIEITVKMDSASAWTQLKAGDSVEIEGPIGGGLALPDPLSEPLCFLAAGTGVTPFRSMIRTLIDQSVKVDFWLLYSAKTKAQLLFQEEFAQWSAARSNFHYIPTLTQSENAEWNQETGRINGAFLSRHLPAGPCTFLLCGPSAFVADMENTLRQEKQIPADKIRREKW